MSEETAAQLAEYGYGANGMAQDRPLLICDVDEVVLHLVDPFEQVLGEQGYYLKSHTFQLTGNVFCAQTHRAATQEEVWGGLDRLFVEQATRQNLVDGAVDSLNTLSEKVDILFLTNLPHVYRDVRIEHLTANGLNFPLVTNSGSKVAAMRHIQSQRRGHVGFIDDTPKNLTQAREEIEGMHLFHFMANENFRQLAGEIEGTHFSSGDWVEAAPLIESVLTGD